MKKKKTKNEQEKETAIVDMIFTICFLIIVGVGGFMTVFRTPKKLSYLEGRELKTFKMPNFKTFVLGTFQKNLEDALTDQFPLSQKIKEVTDDKFNFTSYFPVPKKVCLNHYVYLHEERALASCTDQMVELPLTVEERQEDVDNHLAYYNDFNELADTYYYVIPRSYAFDFEKGVLTFDTYSLLKNNLKGKYHIETLDVKNLEDYQKYFFKTDHHWNNKGQYQGYKDIMKMFGKEDEIRSVVDEITIKDPPFYGSASKYARQLKRSEDFSFYTFDIPPYFYMRDGVLTESPHFDEKSKRYKFEYYYNSLYGDDIGEIVYDFKAPEKENLMIWASSYSNPINELIASHFNKTLIIDVRWLESFDYKEYIKANDIDKILVLASTDVIDGYRWNMGGDKDAV